MCVIFFIFVSSWFVSIMKFVNHREFREHVKDLSCLSKDLCRLVLVDNNPFSFLLQPLNGLPCISFSAEHPYDEQVMRLFIALKSNDSRFSIVLLSHLIWQFSGMVLICSSWRSFFLSSNTFLYRRMWGLYSMKSSTCLSGFKCMEFLHPAWLCEVKITNYELWI